MAKIVQYDAANSSIRNRIKSNIEDISEQHNGLKRLSAVLNDCVTEYRQTEQGILHTYENGNVAEESWNINSALEYLSNLLVESNQPLSRADVLETLDELFSSTTLLEEKNDFINKIEECMETLGGPSGKIMSEIIDVNDGILGLYGYAVVDGYKEYKSLFSQEGNSYEQLQENVSWIKSQSKKIKNISKTYEILTQEKFKWPEEVKAGFEFIDAIDTTLDIVDSIKNYGEGLYTGNSEKMAEGASGFINLISGTLKKTDSIKALTKDCQFSVIKPANMLIDYGANMVTNWLTSITQDGITTKEVYYNTFAHSALDVAMDTVFDPSVLAIGYYPVKQMTGMVGIDLEAMYENVSDKTGLAAVFDATGRMKDLIMENSSWDSWTNGLGIMVEGIGDGLSSAGKAIADGAGKLWDNIFG
ncbi:MAG: hypothetical protein J6J44_04960 [Lachnospiraceae bacterium]|nr:hypothetical protein [Lachnospiraceae bacterium]